jgi:hypothetical protein
MQAGAGMAKWKQERRPAGKPARETPCVISPSGAGWKNWQVWVEQNNRKQMRTFKSDKMLKDKTNNRQTTNHMEKILLTIGLMAATTAAFAEGYINFSPGTFQVSTNGTALSPLFNANAPINNLAAGTMGPTAPQNAGDLFYYEMLITPYTGTTPTDLNVWDGTWKASGLFDTNSIGHYGQIAPGPIALNVGNLVGWNAYANGGSTFPNGTNYIMLVGWSANLGASWLQASNSLATAANLDANYFPSLSFFGESDIGWENPSTVSIVGIPTMAAGPNAGGQPITAPDNLIMTMFELPIPEPATFALVGLGGLSLLLVRRRNV